MVTKLGGRGHDDDNSIELGTHRRSPECPSREHDFQGIVQSGGRTEVDPGHRHLRPSTALAKLMAMTSSSGTHIFYTWQTDCRACVWRGITNSWLEDTVEYPSLPHPVLASEVHCHQIDYGPGSQGLLSSDKHLSQN